MVELFPLGQCALGTLAWRHRGQLHLTVIVKAVFALSPNGAALQIEPEPLEPQDVHDRHNPMASVVVAADVAPRKSLCDVFLTGQARPAGLVRQMSVRLALYRHEVALIDKPILVRGDVYGAAPAPFDRMPLVYERAYGGLGFTGNPIGVGASEGDAQPNLIDPDDPCRVACYAPLAAAWPARSQLLRGASRRTMTGSLWELPDEIDFDYFQAAPPDQRIDTLRGGELLILEGVHPQFAQVRSALPRISASAAVFGLGDEHGGRARHETRRTLALRPDTLHIDVDTGRLSWTFRNDVEVATERELNALGVAADIALDEGAARLPTRRPPRGTGRTAPTEAMAAYADADIDATLPIDDTLSMLTPAPVRSTLVSAEPGPPSTEQDGSTPPPMRWHVERSPVSQTLVSPRGLPRPPRKP